MFRASAFLVPLILLLAACNSNQSDPPDYAQITAIDSFGANPSPSPANVGTQFSWTVLGQNLTCQLDVEGNSTVDYTVQNCTSQSRVIHTYGIQGSFDARLTVTGADGKTVQRSTPVLITAPNTPPAIPTLTPSPPPSSTDPFEVLFTWVVTDFDADVTRCRFDAESDGVWDFDALCSGLPTTSSAGKTSTAGFSLRYKYPKKGTFDATLEAADPHISTQKKVRVRVPFNRAPVINTLSATTGPNNTAALNFQVSDPDDDTLSCKVTIQSIGTFSYSKCRNLTRNLNFADSGSYRVTLEVSDGIQTTSKTITIAFNGPKPPPPMPGVCVESATGLIEDGFPLYGPFKSAYSIAFSPDGYHFATGDENGFIQVWRFDNQGKVFFLASLVDPNLAGSDLRRAHEKNYVKDLVFSPDGRTLASIGWDDYVKLWDVPTTSHLATLDHPTHAATLTTDGEAVAFSPDGSVLAVGDESGLLSLYDVSDPENPAHLSDAVDPDDGSDAGAWVDDLKFTPDGKTLVSGHNLDYQVRLWNVSNPATPSRLAKVSDREYPNSGFPNDVYDMDISPDGKFLVIGGNALDFNRNGQQVLSVIDISNPASPADAARPVYGSGGTNALVYSPDGKTLAVGNLSGEIYLFNTSSPLTDNSTPIASLISPNGMDGNVEALAFSPDGKYLVAVGSSADIVMWNVSNPASPTEHFREVLKDHEVYKVAFLDDSWLVQANGDDAELLFINRAPGQFGRAAPPLAYDTNSGNNFDTLVAGSGIVAGSYTDYSNFPNTTGHVELWNASNPTSASYIATINTGLKEVTALALFPDGKTLAVGGKGDSYGLELWNVDVLPPVKLSSNTDNATVTSVAVSPDGQTLATGDEYAYINLYNVSNLASPSVIDFFDGNSEVYTTVDLSYQGSSKYLVAGSDDGAVKLFNISSLSSTSMNSPTTVESGSDSSVLAVFTRDGSSIVTTDQAEARIRVYPLANLASPTTYTTSAAEFTQLVFSPNGHVLATPSTLRDHYQTRLWYWNYAIICPAW